MINNKLDLKDLCDYICKKMAKKLNFLARIRNRIITVQGTDRATLRVL